MTSSGDRSSGGLFGFVPGNLQVDDMGAAGKAVLALSVLLVVALVLLGGLFAVGTFFFYDSYSSSYEYDVDIYVEGDAEDAEFLVPLPVQNGEHHLGDVHYTESERFAGIDYAVVDTEHGPMLNIEVDEIEEGPHWHSLWVSSRIEVDESIDTRDPRGDEPMVSPLELVERELEETIHARWPDRRDFDASSTAYIEHGGDQDVDFGVSVWYRGGNDWWTGGWNGNYYETVVSGDHGVQGSDGVWVELDGWHTEGGGRYPAFPPTPS